MSLYKLTRKQWRRVDWIVIAPKIKRAGHDLVHVRRMLNWWAWVDLDMGVAGRLRLAERASVRDHGQD